METRGLYIGEDTNIHIVFDSGFSVSITPSKDYFQGKMTPVTKTMAGLGTPAQIDEEGIVSWKVKDDYGVTQVIKIKAYYIPSSSIRLFSPQSYFIQEKGGEFNLHKDNS